ncbi:LPO_1073/Vpar_1526 family protein [Enterococcus larvae]|uniref:LPO_1073/Vpar_1526 family protein n=1 Tax=Enterococcus larvae TaxID=2794352 RepID=UPI003F3216B0
MMSKKKIDSGDNSNNYQAEGDITVYQGMSYSEIKELSKDTVMQVFKENFYTLGKDLETQINQRAEDILNEYLNKLGSIDENLVEKTQSVDLRASIYEAQRGYVRNHNGTQKDILTNLLVKKTQEQDDEFYQIVMREAINSVTKLSKDQIDLLALQFIVREMTFSVPVPFEVFYLTCVNKLERYFDIDHRNDLEYMQSVGCLNYLPLHIYRFEEVIKIKGLLGLNTDEEINEVLKTNDHMKKINDFWEKSGGLTSLTPVGRAIAVTRIENMNMVAGDTKHIINRDGAKFI